MKTPRISPLLINDDQPQHLKAMQKAILAAIGLHLMLLILLPDLPKLIIPSIDRGLALNVFIRPPVTEKEFEQSLRQTLPLSNDRNNRLDSELTLRTPEIGEDDIPSEAAPEQQGTVSQATKAEPSGQEASTDTASNIIISFTAIRQFAKNYVAAQSQEKQSEFDYRKNSYRSDFSARRRSKTESRQNRFGDIYVRDETSRGDICFVQKADNSQSELAVNVVQFFRCGRKPLELELGSG